MEDKNTARQGVVLMLIHTVCFVQCLAQKIPRG